MADIKNNSGIIIVSIKIAIPKTTTAHEKRVSASPETVKKLCAMGCTVTIETGAGDAASITDAMFKDAGAKIVKTAKDALENADIILAVQPPADSEISQIKKGALLVTQMHSYKNEALVKKLADAGIDVFAMELVPRISRAQSMDVLSSQANLAGYKAVLDAAEYFTRAFPMMMTAAGTVPPARVFIMGAGVAGLQAIATAKRLGAVVSATDVRPAAKEQVKSLGGTFVAVEDEEFKEAETAGGYAKEMSAAYQEKQAALIEETIAKQDIVITTALIPGRPAPRLITEKMVKSMKPGSVLVDLAVEQGGNIDGSVAGKAVTKDGVTIIGHHNVPSRLSTSAATLYAKNLLNLLGIVIKDGKIATDWEDDIIKGIALTKDGKVIHPLFAPASSPKSPAPKEKAQAAPKAGTETKTDTKEKAGAGVTKTTTAASSSAASSAAPKKKTPAAKKHAVKKAVAKTKAKEVTPSGKPIAKTSTPKAAEPKSAAKK